MRVYLGTHSCSATDNMTATHATVKTFDLQSWRLRTQNNYGQILFTPRLFYDLDRHKINLCGTIHPNRKDMLCVFGPKQLKLKRGDIRVRTWGGLTALVWKDTWEVYMVTNMDPPPAEGNFCDNCNRPVKPHIMEQYNRHIGYVDNSDCMNNSYLMSWRTFKWTMKLFFHFLDLTVLNSWILLSSCGTKYTHPDFRLLLVRNLIEEAGKSQDRPTPRLVGRPSAGVKKVLDSRLTITNTGQRNHPLNCAAICVFTWSEKGHNV